MDGPDGSHPRGRRLRLRLVKLAARVVELKIQVKIHLPTTDPDQAIFAMLVDRPAASRHLRAGA